MQTIDDVAGEIAHAPEGERLRIVRQFIMDADSATDLAGAINREPRTTGDQRWDALLAGVAEDLAFARRLPTPAWTADPRRFLETWWFVTRYKAMHATAMAHTPAALANRGVFITRASLVNV
jgi:hypothetical protein